MMMTKLNNDDVTSQTQNNSGRDMMCVPDPVLFPSSIASTTYTRLFGQMRYVHKVPILLYTCIFY